ncbi:MAG: FHA domain-containing protein [Polyangiaceae bacterium]|nr:FHA domain-containing protein [Polyangiaceae bacterium]
MGVLELADRTRITLAARTLVGRSRRCLVRIEHPLVSGEHAAIVWSSETSGWFVRDLGSTNGTLVGTQRLSTTTKAPLRPGARLVFGESECSLASDGPPVTRALCPEDGRSIGEDDDGVLLLSSDPVQLVVPQGDGWVLDSAGTPVRTVRDQEVVEAAGAQWVLELCPPSDTSIDSTKRVQAIWLHDTTLRFIVSRDGEHVTMQLVRSSEQVIDVPEYSHQQVLLTLARERLNDERNGLPVAEAGWIYHDDLQRVLGMSRQRVNTDLHRARRVLESHGVARAQDIVERRLQTQQLRIGVRRLEIDPG